MAIPINIVVSFLLSLDLLYNSVPPILVIGWFLAILLLSSIRYAISRFFISTHYYEKNTRATLFSFTLLTVLMGMVWGSAYIIFTPYLSELQVFIIILIYGGMCAGSIASLSVYLPAYYAFLLAVFLPVVIHHYTMLDFDRIILAITFTLFVVMLMVIAKANGKMVHKILSLSEQKESLIKKLKIMSITDSLTELYNNRYFKKLFKEEFHRAKRNKYALNLVSIDIDRFKMINDSFGHPYGDKFLIYTANLLKDTFQRSNDTVFRLGGDEFIVIVANMSVENVFARCRTLKNHFKQKDPPYDSRLEQQKMIFNQVSLSIGIVHIPYHASVDIESAFLSVDKALYQAKNEGRDKIVINEMT